MKIMQRTDKNAGVALRMTVEVSWWGLTVTRQRPRVGGGWYVREATGCPWPWVRDR